MPTEISFCESQVNSSPLDTKLFCHQTLLPVNDSEAKGGVPANIKSPASPADRNVAAKGWRV